MIKSVVTEIKRMDKLATKAKICYFLLSTYFLSKFDFSTKESNFYYFVFADWEVSINVKNVRLRLVSRCLKLILCRQMANKKLQLNLWRKELVFVTGISLLDLCFST